MIARQLIMVDNRNRRITPLYYLISDEKLFTAAKLLRFLAITFSSEKSRSCFMESVNLDVIY